MRSARKLVLRSERLVELSASDLDGLVGGAATRGDSCHLTFYPCPTDIGCPTLPLDACAGTTVGGG